ncbi:MAG: hypothetical protein U1E76_14660 [Planctomycetota bacterium]
MTLLCLIAGLSLAADVDPDLLAAMRARAIGPAGMSGRVAAIAAVESDPNIIYVGAATGGLWKSVDGGMSWQPRFDEQSVASIGAIAIDPRSADVVWVGTGEGNPRNSASVGNGMYKSLDGGRTWKQLGLAQSERIHRICLDPHDPEIAYVAALGPTWSDGTERGVFKTTDGGATWQRVLYVDQRTGCGDLVMDPTNPLKLFAAMWEHRRSPYSFQSGGPGSGLYVTRDGGKSWQQITARDGLPAGELGRMGLAIAPSNPNVVYALIEAAQNALVRSDDGGLSFHTVNAETNIALRPFYFADLRIDPANPERVYSLHFIVTVSNDGGRSFAPLMRAAIHPDHHAMWIHPRNPQSSSTATTAASPSRRTAARASGSCAICRLRSSTTWRSTWTFRTTCTAACRTTGRGAGRARCGNRAGSATTTGRRSASATASAPCRCRTTRSRVTR